MSKQAATIKVWCRSDDLERTANLISWAVGHRIEIPEEPTEVKHKYFFIVTDIEQYESEEALLKRMGFDVISKIAGVISWELLPRGYDYMRSVQRQGDEKYNELLVLFDDLPIPISIIRHIDGSYAWKWMSASGHADTCKETIKAALTHVVRSYAMLRSEMVG